MRPSGALELTTNHWQSRLALLLAVGSPGKRCLQTYDVVVRFRPFSDGMHTHFLLGRAAILRATNDQRRRIEPSFPSNIRSRPSPLPNLQAQRPDFRSCNFAPAPPMAGYAAMAASIQRLFSASC